MDFKKSLLTELYGNRMDSTVSRCTVYYAFQTGQMMLP